MKVFITGSTTGLGLIAGQILMQQGHEVVLHARTKNSVMKEKTLYVIGDLSKRSEVLSVADQANEFGTFDAVIHNAGVYTSGPEELFDVNVLAPYLLCTKMHRPARMIILSSGLHTGGTMNLDRAKCNYSDTKLFALMLAKHFARQWPQSFCNAVNPGWVPTRMGGAGATDDLKKGAETQAWLAVSSNPAALVTGKYFFHQQEQKYNHLADSKINQEKLIAYLNKQL